MLQMYSINTKTVMKIQTIQKALDSISPPAKKKSCFKVHQHVIPFE